MVPSGGIGGVIKQVAGSIDTAKRDGGIVHGSWVKCDFVALTTTVLLGCTRYFRNGDVTLGICDGIPGPNRSELMATDKNPP